MRPFEGSSLAIAAGVVFTAMLVAAAAGDLRTRRIPNKLVAILAVCGIAYSIVRAPVLEGLTQSGGGLLAGLALWLPFYALGWLGAGDVKLYAAAGAWLGPARAVEGAIIGALFGAVLALVYMMKSQGMKEAAQTLGMAAATPEMLARPSGSGKRSTLPYGVAIAFGALWAGWMPRILNF
ncbi:MAG TPA: prepilin peptidase [Gemmatimonadaceae bacterium]